MRKSLAVLVLLSAALVFWVGCWEENESEEAVVKTVIRSENAPQAIGPYSQAILVGNTLYCSGQIAINPKTGELVTGDFGAEVKQVLDNLGAVLQAAGMDYADVVKATVFLKDLNQYGVFNEIYATYFKENPPARETVQVARLPKDVNIEISFIALKTGQGTKPKADWQH